jgi:8-oxo-dGTP pyrophosphatase MutT (NUDIX family)
MNTLYVQKAWWILVEDWCIYIVYRKSHDDYTLPKGHVDSWETHEQAAIREMKEETWFTVAIDSFCCNSHYQYTKWDNIYDCTVKYYFVHRTDDTVSELADDVDKVMAVSLDEAVAFLSYPTDQRVMELVLQAIKK